MTHHRTAQLREQGFTIFEKLYDRTWVERVRESIIGIYDNVGRPGCYAPETREHAPGLFIGPAGFAIPQLLPRLSPDERIVRQEVTDVLRAYLGQDMKLEIAGAVLTDNTRPRFAWHNHVGGHDDGMYRKSGHWPTVDAPRRVMTLTYLQDLDADHGPLHLYPHQVGEPSAPPHDPKAESWPDEIVLRPAAGSLVVIDECAWHAVDAPVSEDERIFVGLAYAAADAEVGGWADPGIASVKEHHRDPLLHALLPGR